MTQISPFRLYGILLIGVVVLGGSAILIRLAGEAPPMAIAAYRMLGGAGLLLGFTARGIGPAWRGLSRRERALWLASAFALAFHFSFWIESLRHTSVASSVILVTMNPIFAGLGGFFLLGEREAPALWAGVFCTFLGGVILIGTDAYAWAGSGYGNLLALAGAAMASVYLLCGRRLRGRIALGPYITVCYGLSGLLLAGGGWMAGQPLRGFSAETWLLLLAMALGPTLLGHTSVNFALRYLSSGKVALIIVGEPLVASVLAWWVLAEPLTAVRAASGALMLAGIVWGSRSNG
ncbi:MAG: DMT family transporter [bacterium]|nr:DMT family transporter [bacterium]